MYDRAFQGWLGQAGGVVERGVEKSIRSRDFRVISAATDVHSGMVRRL